MLVVYLIIFVGVYTSLLLYNNEQRISMRLQDLIKTFSASSTSSLTLKSNGGNSADDGQVTQHAVEAVTPVSTQNKVIQHEAPRTNEAKAQRNENSSMKKQDSKVTLSQKKHAGNEVILLNSDSDDTKRNAQHTDNGNQITISPNADKAKAISPEVFNKDSPFYGNLFMDEYGLPLKNRPQVEIYEQSKIEWHSWKLYFPELMLSFQKLEKFNLTLVKTMSTRFASVSFDRTNYNVGEELQATITSLDWEWRPKQFGGDYYRARLFQESGIRPSDGIPCQIVDNHDGTYTVTAPLSFEGRMMLEVKLVNSVEAIKEIAMKTEQLISWKKRYEAILESGEAVTCNVQMASNRQNIVE